MSENYGDVLQQLQSAGLLVTELDTTGRMVRCRVEGSRERRGWYALHELNTSAGEVLVVGTYGVWHGNENGATKVDLRKRDKTFCDTTRARLAQADELLELVRNQSRTVIDPADPWRGLYHPSRLPARNADGEILCHPDVPMWADGREVSLRPLFLAQGFDLAVVEGEFSEEGIGSGVYNAAQELHDWNPEAPGEDWRLAWLGETEDGLAAWFVRPLAIAAMASKETAHG
ncbi:TPA: hypothetical protein ACXM5A_000332 [Stenotrophomonas maltophilia]